MSAHCSSTYSKIGMTEKISIEDDIQIHEALHIFKKKEKKCNDQEIPSTIAVKL